MDTRITAAILAVAVAGGGYAGWRLYADLGTLRIEVANTKSALEKAKGETSAAKGKLAELEKERDELKIEMTGMRAERDSAKVLLESAQRYNERMAQDLLLAQKQIEYLRLRTNVPPSQLMVPQRPMVIQALPAPRPQSATVGVGVSAPVPGQGYGPAQGSTPGR